MSASINKFPVQYASHWEEGAVYSAAHLDLLTGEVLDIETSEDGVEYEHHLKDVICIKAGVSAESDDVEVHEREGTYMIHSDALAHLREIAIPMMIDDMRDRLMDSDEHDTDAAVPGVAEDAHSFLAELSSLIAHFNRPVAKQAFKIFKMANDGKNPENYVIEAGRSGDEGLYNEFRVSILDKDGECVGDTLIGLNEAGEPRVLVTTDGEGDGAHQIAVFPLREANEAVQLLHQDEPADSPLPGIK